MGAGGVGYIMNNEDEYWPRSAEDRERWASLRAWEPERLEPHIPALLAWLKTGDAGSVEAAAALLPLEYALIVPIRSILKGGDARWKAAVLERLVADLPKDVALELAPDLLTLAMSESEADVEEGVDELAEELLSRWL
ncbi:DUF5071 domain-containing protein [Paenibacillus antri]|uniref:DUF5071 domain-containing protein n=2 Tax=Paenibacillus antri TaxID=2582848 RepID=A0A5R9G744_9BACL|nr:DUF5071 domain-containing protein [Paenibacillus antri]